MNQEVEQIEKQSNLITSSATQLIVVDNEGNEEGACLLKVVKSAVNEVKNCFDPIVASAHETHKKATTQRKKYLDPLQKAEKLIKDKMATWIMAEKRKAAIEQDRLRKQAEESGAKFSPTIAPQVNKVEGQVLTDRWTAVVVDKTKIPLDYMEADMAKLNACARAKKGDSNIPGVSFICQTGISHRS